MRKVYLRHQADPLIQFVGSRYERFRHEPAEPIYWTCWSSEGTADLVKKIVSRAFDTDLFRDLQIDSLKAAELIDKDLRGNEIDVIEILKPVFFRNKGAYLVGRVIYKNGKAAPLALALLHQEDGVFIDAVLATQKSVENIFGFTRSYFQVDSPTPNRLVHFLKNVLPRHYSSELYISLGFDKHGKTELFRDLKYHLSLNEAIIEAPGIEGMVMMVFTMSTFDYVFKIIKDKFEPPKTVTHEIVRERYQYIFVHDRVGRLMDTQEFNFVKFPKEKFDPKLLEELLQKAGDTVIVQGNDVLIKHMYIERKVVPLNIFVKEFPENDVVDVVSDYGQAMKDLSAANIFPGDIFLKNFGVTKNNRVVLYDYDEVCRITDCDFDTLPDRDDFGGEIHVDPDTVFPSELRTYLGLKQPYRAHFEAEHSDIFTVEFWNQRKKEIEDGRWVDFYPYGKEHRLD